MKDFHVQRVVAALIPVVEETLEEADTPMIRLLIEQYMDKGNTRNRLIASMIAVKVTQALETARILEDSLVDAVEAKLRARAEGN